MGLFHQHNHQKTCDHHHHDHGSSQSAKNISIALGLNASFALIELVGGYFTQSTAIQADAIHDLGDSAVLAIALLLQYVSLMPPRAGFNYGFRRLSLLSAFATAALLMVGSVFVCLQAISRFYDPITPHLDGMLGLAILGVAVNGFAAWRMSQGKSQNEQAISWHMMEDLFGWLAVLVSSIVMRFWDSPWLDPLLAVVIAVIIFVGAIRSMMRSGALFLQAVPREVDEQKMQAAIGGVSGILGVEKLHVWSLDGEHHVCTCKVFVSETMTMQEWRSLRLKIEEIILGFGRFEINIEPQTQTNQIPQSFRLGTQF